MYRVLLAIDGDERRAERAAESVAALPCSDEDVEVVALNVFAQFEVGDETIVDSSDVYDETDFPESVSVAVDVLTDAGVDVTKRREHGDPASVITSVAAEIDADCIAVGGRQRSPTAKVLFGSVTQAVLLSANRPVLVTTPD